MPKALLELGVIVGGVVFAVAAMLAMVARSGAWAVLGGTIAVAGLVLCVGSDRRIARQQRERAAAAVGRAAAKASGGRYQVSVRWGRLLLLRAGMWAAIAIGMMAAFAAWYSYERKLMLFLVLLGFLACGALLRVNAMVRAVRRAGYGLRADSRGLAHWSIETVIPWHDVTALNLESRRSIFDDSKLIGDTYRYYLVATLCPTAARMRAARPIPLWGVEAAFVDARGVHIPLGYMDDEPEAVVVAVRAVAERAGVPLEPRVDADAGWEP